MGNLFSRLAQWASRQAGRAHTFAIALALILVWAITGPLFHWSDTWQLVINTGTTIVTFLMVFLIQNTQNRDTEALQLKLDELIRVSRGARNQLLTLEDLTDQELDRVKASFERLAKQKPAFAEEMDEVLETIAGTQEDPDQAQEARPKSKAAESKAGGP